jgi:hypothetical protein
MSNISKAVNYIKIKRSFFTHLETRIPFFPTQKCLNVSNLSKLFTIFDLISLMFHFFSRYKKTLASHYKTYKPFVNLDSMYIKS